MKLKKGNKTFPRLVFHTNADGNAVGQPVSDSEAVRDAYDKLAMEGCIVGPPVGTPWVPVEDMLKWGYVGIYRVRYPTDAEPSYDHAKAYQQKLLKDWANAYSALEDELEDAKEETHYWMDKYEKEVASRQKAERDLESAELDVSHQQKRLKDWADKYSALEEKLSKVKRMWMEDLEALKQVAVDRIATLHGGLNAVERQSLKRLLSQEMIWRVKEQALGLKENNGQKS